MFKEEKRSIGRPKLADTKLKKKSLIILGICLVAVLTLLFTGAYKLNIIKFGRLKGEVICGENEIPLKFQPKTAANPEGLHDYGFTDSNFYSAVVTLIQKNDSSKTCLNIEEDDFETVRGLSNTSVSPDTYNYKTDVIKNATNFNGIQYLTELNLLYLPNNNISSLDLSHNTSLGDISSESQSVKLNDNQLTTLDLSHNPSVRWLDLSNNNLSSITLGEKNELGTLILSNNNLTGTLDVSNMPELDRIFLENNNLTGLVLGNQEIYQINISNNQIEGSLVINGTESNIDYYSDSDSDIDVSNNKLTSLELSNHNVYAINASSNNLTNFSLTNSCVRYLNVDDNNLSNININNVNAEYINVAYNNLSTLDLTNFIDLKGVVASYNNISNIIGLADKTNIEDLHLSNNNISQITLTSNTNIEDLTLASNNLSGVLDLSTLDKLDGGYLGIDLSNNNLTGVKFYEGTNIQTLYLSHNNLDSFNVTGLDVSGLRDLSLAHNNISEMVMEGYDELFQIDISYNNLSSLDISNCTSLDTIAINNNPMTNTKYLNVGDNIDYEISLIYNDELEVTQSITDESVISYESNKLKALKNGRSSIILSSDNMYGIDGEIYRELTAGPWGMYLISESRFIRIYGQDYFDNLDDTIILKDGFFEQEVVVYGVTSNDYVIDTDNKKIDAKGEEFDPSKIDLGDEGLTGVVEGDEFIIKDGDTTVDTYTIINYKGAKENNNSTKSNATKTTTKTTKKKATGKAITNKAKTILDRVLPKTNNDKNFAKNAKIIKTKTQVKWYIPVLIIVGLSLLLFIILLLKKRRKDDEEKTK